MVLALLAGGCGGGSQDSGGESGAKAQLTSSRSTVADRKETGKIKAVRWGVGQVRSRALRLGVEVTYCGSREPEPFIQRVERRHGRGGLILTVFVRVGPKHLEPGGCVEDALILLKWVRIGDRSKPLFDGSTAPPSRRQLP
jgi:hypothetical protein